MKRVYDLFVSLQSSVCILTVLDIFGFSCNRHMFLMLCKAHCLVKRKYGIKSMVAFLLQMCHDWKLGNSSYGCHTTWFSCIYQSSKAGNSVLAIVFVRCALSLPQLETMFRIFWKSFLSYDTFIAGMRYVIKVNWGELSIAF